MLYCLLPKKLLNLLVDFRDRGKYINNSTRILLYNHPLSCSYFLESLEFSDRLYFYVLILFKYYHSNLSNLYILVMLPKTFIFPLTLILYKLIVNLNKKSLVAFCFHPLSVGLLFPRICTQYRGSYHVCVHFL